MSHAIERIALSERSLATSKTEARSSVSNLDSMDSMASSKMPQVAAKESMGDPLADVEGHRGDGVVTKLDGVAARLHMQDLMNHHAQKALVVQSKRVMGGISRFRVVLRDIVGTAYFDLMIGLLVLADTACIILQQELYPEVDLEFDTTELALRTASVAVTVAFAVELVARGLAQIGLGWSWLLALDGLIVAGSFVEVFVFSIDPLNQTALRLLRPLRGLRLLRAVRGMVRLLRRSASADLALGAFERSLRPLAMIGVAIILSILAASVILVLQLPGIVDDLKEETELEQDVLLRFGSVFAATLTVLKEVFGAHELGTLLMSLFALSRRRFDLTMFVGSVLIFLLISSLCFSGIVCGVLLSQVILKKGDAAADGGMESFRRNQELVLSLNQAFKNAGFDSGDNIDLKDILSVLAVDAAGKLQKSNSEWLQLLGPDGHGRETKEQPVEKHIDDKTEEEEDDDDEETSTGEKEEELDFKQFKCKLQDKGVTMEDLHTAYHELALFGPVCVEDFILCAFRHVANIKTVSMLSFNHQQNKVFWRIQFHGQVVEEALHEMRFKIGRLHSILPSMITELEDAAVELRELEALEGRLGQKKQALQALISEREKDCGFAEIPREEAVQAQRYEKELNALLEEAEMEVEKLAGSERLPAQDATHAINALADEMVSELWGTVLEEIKAAEVGQAKRK